MSSPWYSVYMKRNEGKGTMKHSRANCEHLAACVISEIGLELALSYAANKLTDHYMHNQEAFNTDSKALEVEGIEDVLGIDENTTSADCN